MAISDYIINDVKLQSVEAKVGTIQKLFEEFDYSHLPVEEDGNFIGCISKNDLDSFDPDKPLADYKYTLVSYFVFEEDHLLEIFRIIAAKDANLIPVLDNRNKRYLGYLELNDIIGLLEETPFYGEEGNIIIVEKEHHNFSFSQICQIVESNDGRLYGVYISKITDSKTQITLKVGESSINGILQTFRRYNYEIISEHQEDTFLKNLEERSDYLNKFLNI